MEKKIKKAEMTTIVIPTVLSPVKIIDNPKHKNNIDGLKICIAFFI